MIIQHLGCSGFDLDGLGIGLHKCFSKVFERKRVPLPSHGLTHGLEQAVSPRREAPLVTSG